MPDIMPIPALQLRAKELWPASNKIVLIEHHGMLFQVTFRNMFYKGAFYKSGSAPVFFWKDTNFGRLLGQLREVALSVQRYQHIFGDSGYV